MDNDETGDCVSDVVNVGSGVGWATASWTGGAETVTVGTLVGTEKLGCKEKLEGEMIWSPVRMSGIGNEVSSFFIFDVITD